MNAHSEPVAAAEMRVGVGSFAFGWATGHASPSFDEHALIARIQSDVAAMRARADSGLP